MWSFIIPGLRNKKTEYIDTGTETQRQVQTQDDAAEMVEGKATEAIQQLLIGEVIPMLNTIWTEASTFTVRQIEVVIKRFKKKQVL